MKRFFFSSTPRMDHHHYHPENVFGPVFVCLFVVVCFLDKVVMNVPNGVVRHVQNKFTFSSVPVYVPLQHFKAVYFLDLQIDR